MQLVVLPASQLLRQRPYRQQRLLLQLRALHCRLLRWGPNALDMACLAAAGVAAVAVQMRYSGCCWGAGAVDACASRQVYVHAWMVQAGA